jgi:hypothetical protein
LTVVKETDTTIDTYLDQRLLSEGRLTGWSLTAQGQLFEGLAYKASAGSERLLHPYAEGSSSRVSKNYHDFSLDYRLVGDARLGLSLREGVAGKRYGIKLGQQGWNLYLENDKAALYGLNTWRVGVTFNLGNPAIRGNGSNVNTKWSLMSELGDIDRKPSEFPSAYLLKVDPTAVKRISSAAKGAISWTVGGNLGEFNDAGTPSRSSISIQLQASASNANPVIYSLYSGTLPPGVSLNSTGLIAGAASAVAADTVYLFRVKAQSGGSSDIISPELNIKIKAPIQVGVSFEVSFNNTYFNKNTRSDGFVDYYFAYVDPAGIVWTTVYDEAIGYVFVLSESGRVMTSSDGRGTYTRRIISGDANAAVVEGVHSRGFTTREEIFKMQDVSNSFLGRRLSFLNGCAIGVDALYSIAPDGSWVNSCGENGRIFMTNDNDYCSGSRNGFSGEIKNVMCFMNITRNTNHMVALKSGSFTSGGDLLFMGHDTDAPRYWTIPFAAP